MDWEVVVFLEKRLVSINLILHHTARWQEWKRSVACGDLPCPYTCSFDSPSLLLIAFEEGR